MRYLLKKYVLIFTVSLFCAFINHSLCIAMLTDSDPHRQHDLAKSRLWEWRNSLNFCVNSAIPHEFGTTKPFSADLTHLTLADIERQFSFEVEQHRDYLRGELIKHKRSLEAERMKIQLGQMELERETARLGSLFRENQEVIDSITETLVGAPQTRGGSETANGFRARKSAWSTREGAKVHQLNTLFAKYEIVVAEKSSHIDEALKLRETLSKRQAELSGEIEHIKRRMSEGEQKIHDIERDVSAFERQLSTVSTTINAATVGISLILKKSSDPNNYVLFSPLFFGGIPIVFSSSSLAEMKSKFYIIVPSRRDFATDLAMRLKVDKTPYSNTIASYSKLKDTETTAIDYLLSNPGDGKHISVLHKTISELLSKTGYSCADVKSLCVHIHTKKDPCGLCTRLIEGLYIGLNQPGFISPEIKTILKNIVLVSSCDDYRIGKARELFLRTDTTSTGTSSAAAAAASSASTTTLTKPYDLSELARDYLFFKLLYGGF